MKMKSWLPKGGENVFQRMKKKTEEAKSKGKILWPLTIGQPAGPALMSARKTASKLIMSDNEAVHEYQDNGSPGIPDFAKRFVAAHFDGETGSRILTDPNLAFLPAPGIKPMLGLIPMACGHIRVWDEKENKFFLYNPDVLVGTMTDPGYETPAVWCDYLGAKNYPLSMNVENNFMFSIEDINPKTKLLMLNSPHNPTGIGFTEDIWRWICEFCQRVGARLINDAAYASLIFSKSKKSICMLAEVAPDYPDLEWMEFYSGSKAVGNGTGWRAAGIVGSRGSIEDLANIKGNTDSGFVAATAAGILSSMEDDFPSVVENCAMYENRTGYLIETLQERDLWLAVEPEATFFNTWISPKRAFGQEVFGAEHFNGLLMAETGLYGIPFGDILRFTVTKPVDSPEWDMAIKKAFDKAQVSY